MLPSGKEELQRLLLAIVALEQRLNRLSGLEAKDVAMRAEWAADVARLTLAVIESAVELTVVAEAPSRPREPRGEAHPAQQPSLRSQLESLQHAIAAMAAFGRGDHAEGVHETLASVKDYAHLLPRELCQFLPLMADLAAAASVEDVQAALSAAAAPLGNWRAKRQQRFSASISALAGLSGGGELPMSSRLSFGGNAGLAGGPLAAVGFDLARHIEGSSWTIGGFLSILDVGQLAYVRIHTGLTDTPGGATGASTASEVSFLSVLSPGAYLRIGAGSSPLTFGVGAAFAPQMRKYLFSTASGAADQDLFSLLRLTAFLAVDVSLFRIH